MQGSPNSMRKSIGPRRPIYESYYIGEYDFLDPNGNYHKIQPRDDINKYNQYICPLQSQQNHLYKATARV